MATRNTRNEAQEMIDRMIARRPAAEFRIVEDTFTAGNGTIKTQYRVEEKTICPLCGIEFWHIDYGNTEATHTQCDVEQEQEFEKQSRIEQEANRKEVEIKNWIAETDN